MDQLEQVNLIQGETYVSDNPREVIVTILGSCVAACVWDPVAQIGGMNHFLLPGVRSKDSQGLRYGMNSMEILINGLLKQGAQRQCLKAKLFGGANLIKSMAQIGSKNAQFADWYMQNEGIEVVARCFGGERGRKVRFCPTTGQAQRRFMALSDDPVVKVTSPTQSEDNITLF